MLQTLSRFYELLPIFGIEKTKTHYFVFWKTGKKGYLKLRISLFSWQKHNYKIKAVHNLNVRYSKHITLWGFCGIHSFIKVFLSSDICSLHICILSSDEHTYFRTIAICFTCSLTFHLSMSSQPVKLGQHL